MTDNLIRRIEGTQNPTVVGLDPTYEMIPSFLKQRALKYYGKTPKAVARMFYEFNCGIIDAIADIVPAVKPQIAMYEKYGIEGMDAYLQTVEYAKKRKLIVIGDIKRGDISSTAQCYAAHIDGTDIEGTHFDLWKEDFVTINPYMGYDGIKPFCEAAKKRDKGIFVLLKTSNPSSSEIQDLIYNGAPLYEHVGGLISSWGEDSIGMYGYSRVGAVVGATHREQGEALRKICPHVFFLVPGYGAQGGKAEDLKGFFDEKHRGAIVNSSRGIIAAYKKVDDAKEEDFAKYARDAALAMREDLRKAIY